MTAPTFEIIGDELSDAAIDALAEFLLDLVERGSPAAAPAEAEAQA